MGALLRPSPDLTFTDARHLQSHTFSKATATEAAHGNCLLHAGDAVRRKLGFGINTLMVAMVVIRVVVVVVVVVMVMVVAIIRDGWRVKRNIYGRLLKYTFG